MRNRGVTLIELLVVIAVVGTLIVALWFNFEGWQGGYRVESQIKTLYNDLMEARVRSMQRNRVHFVDFPDDETYTLYEDDSDGTEKVPDGDGNFQRGSGDSFDTELPSYPKTIDYSIEIGDIATEPPVFFILSSRGLISPERTICIFTDFDNDTKSDLNPDYDCIVLTATRIKMGKLKKQDTDGGICRSESNGGDCEVK